MSDGNGNGPLYHIPPELLKVIFHECLPETDLPPPDIPLKLAQICAYWRAVALMTPTLWSKLRLDFEGCSDAISDAKLVELVERFLSRSRNLPLDIRLSSNVIFTEGVPAAKLLLSQMPRIRTLRLRVAKAIAYEVFRRLRLGAPILEHLEMITLLRGHRTATLNLNVIPRLRDLNIYGFQPSLTTDVDLPNVQRIRFMIMQPPDMPIRQLSFLKHCPNLVSLDIAISNDPNAGIIAQNLPVVVPRLLNLVLSSDGLRGATRYTLLLSLLENISTPALQSLELNINEDETSLVLGTQIQRFLQRSSAPLEDLVLRYKFLDTSHLIDILRVTPSIRRLSLWSGMVTDGVLEALTYRLGPTDSDEHWIAPLCPKLRQLELVTADDLSEETLVEMILSRRKMADISNENAPRSADATLAECGVEILQELAIVDLGPGLASELDNDKPRFAWLHEHPDIAKCISEGLKIDVCAFRFHS